MPYIVDYKGKTPLSYALQIKDIGTIHSISNYFYAHPDKIVLTSNDFFDLFQWATLSSVKNFFTVMIHKPSFANVILEEFARIP